MLIYMIAGVMIAVSAYLFISIFPKMIFQAKRQKRGNKIYLTFDDGPSAEYTNELLDLLKNYDIKASFFCVALFAEQNPDIIKRMAREKHLIGLHSLNHKNAALMNRIQTKKDFTESIRIMCGLEQNIEFFRPPWGRINLFTISQLKRHHLKMVFWNVMAEDWRGSTTPEIIEKKLITRTLGNDVICLHDGRGENGAPKRTIEALQKVIPTFLNKGFIFETVDKYVK